MISKYRDLYNKVAADVESQSHKNTYYIATAANAIKHTKDDFVKNKYYNLPWTVRLFLQNGNFSDETKKGTVQYFSKEESDVKNLIYLEEMGMAISKIDELKQTGNSKIDELKQTGISKINNVDDYLKSIMTSKGTKEKRLWLLQTGGKKNRKTKRRKNTRRKKM